MGSAYLHTHLMPLSHGGDLLRLQRSLPTASERQWIDLSSAVNREPWPVPAIPAESWMELPDLQCLLAAAGDYYGRAELLPIAGTQQAIEWLPVLLPSVAKERSSIGESQADPSQSCKPIQRVMLPAIGYQEHAFAWQKWGYQICTYHSLDELLCTDWLVAVVIQPNNPTAERYPSAQLQALVELAHTRQAWVLVDEAFIDVIEEQSLLTKAWTQTWPDALIV